MIQDLKNSIQKGRSGVSSQTPTAIIAQKYAAETTYTFHSETDIANEKSEPTSMEINGNFHQL